jgi:hypothetical protein
MPASLNASSVGAKTVNCLLPLSVSTSPASVTAAASTVKPFAMATSTMVISPDAPGCRKV